MCPKDSDSSSLTMAWPMSCFTSPVCAATVHHAPMKALPPCRVLSMDESTAVHPAQMPMPRTRVTVTPTSGLERAIVKWFNRLRGFGFLTRGEGTPDIFVDMEI